MRQVIFLCLALMGCSKPAPPPPAPCFDTIFAWHKVVDQIAPTPGESKPFSCPHANQSMNYRRYDSIIFCECIR